MQRISIAVIALMIAMAPLEALVRFDAPMSDKLFLGFEFDELAQRSFSDIGIDNFSIHAGQRFNAGSFPIKLGWSFLGYRVDLSRQHLTDPNQEMYIDGDRSVLSGNLDSYQLFLDGGLCNLSFFRMGGRYLLRVIPELGLGLAYGDWNFQNDLSGESYSLSALTANLRIDLRSTIFDVVYIDYPVMDGFVYLLKNRPVYGQLGNVTISRPEGYGLTALLTVGVLVSY